MFDGLEVGGRVTASTFFGVFDVPEVDERALSILTPRAVFDWRATASTFLGVLNDPEVDRKALSILTPLAVLDGKITLTPLV